jgi:hypothetical protein
MKLTTLVGQGLLKVQREFAHSVSDPGVVAGDREGKEQPIKLGEENRDVLSHTQIVELSLTQGFDIVFIDSKALPDSSDKSIERVKGGGRECVRACHPIKGGARELGRKVRAARVLKWMPSSVVVRVEEVAVYQELELREGHQTIQILPVMTGEGDMITVRHSGENVRDGSVYEQ